MPKLFYVSTSTTTSTVSTTSLCVYVSSTAIAMHVCKRKKKRSMISDIQKSESDIAPARSMVEDDLSAPVVDSSNTELDEREGKFLNYWMTTTVTNTFLSYTATGSMASAICTPIGFTYTFCPVG